MHPIDPKAKPSSKMTPSYQKEPIQNGSNVYSYVTLAPQSLWELLNASNQICFNGTTDWYLGIEAQGSFPHSTS